MDKIPAALKIRIGDRFRYGDRRRNGLWEVTELLPGGVVMLYDKTRSFHARRYQHELRRFLTEGSYRRVGG